MVLVKHKGGDGYVMGYGTDQPIEVSEDEAAMLVGTGRYERVEPAPIPEEKPRRPHVKFDAPPAPAE